MSRYQDIILGVIFCILGLAIAWVANSYGGATGGYPLALGIILSACGILIAIRAIVFMPNQERKLFENSKNFLIVLVGAVAYIGLITPLGFYTASTILMAILPWTLGFRMPFFSLIMTVIFVFLVWLIFYQVFEKTLPDEIWSRYL
jgi:putative tricarboxylic transport membrane protein